MFARLQALAGADGAHPTVSDNVRDALTRGLASMEAQRGNFEALQADVEALRARLDVVVRTAQKTKERVEVPGAPSRDGAKP